MRRRTSTLAAAALVALPAFTAAARGAEGAVRVAATEPSALHAWDARVASLLATGALRVRQERADSLLPGRAHSRLTEMHRGVRVYSGELVLQREGARTVSLFGLLHEGVDVDPSPTLSADQAVAVVERLAGADLGPRRVPELVVLPREDGGYSLAWHTRAFSEAGDHSEYFVDARSGALLLKRSILKTQAPAVGLGTGVLGDSKKMSTTPAPPGATGFVTSDELRPPSLLTFDLRGDRNKLFGFLNGSVTLRSGDLAADADNTWTDGAVVDGHAYAGYTYDYLFKRFGRRGLDNADLEILSIVHPVRREDIFTTPPSLVGLLYLNAFYAGDGVMVYGEGLPANLRDTSGRSWNFLSGALDVVTHELAHGVTDYSSQLIYQGEPGALNESFSDMMAAGAEFFFQEPGNGPRQADYLLAEDVVIPGGLRSMQNPVAYDDPDHYSIRFTGSGDNGGVHINSGIPNHVFYLAIEGGRNRVSGQTVQGVGGANREQIEKVMYRAFVFMMPPTADFATARQVSLQSARDLYGAGSAPERALTQAWDAVGVN